MYTTYVLIIRILASVWTRRHRQTLQGYPSIRVKIHLTSSGRMIRFQKRPYKDARAARAWVGEIRVRTWLGQDSYRSPLRFTSAHLVVLPISAISKLPGVWWSCLYQQFHRDSHQIQGTAQSNFICPNMGVTMNNSPNLPLSFWEKNGDFRREPGFLGDTWGTSFPGRRSAKNSKRPLGARSRSFSNLAPKGSCVSTIFYNHRHEKIWK